MFRRTLVSAILALFPAADRHLGRPLCIFERDFDTLLPSEREVRVISDQQYCS